MVRIRKNIAEMRGYIPGEQPREQSWVKLNTNEGVECSPAALAALRSITDDDLRRYPDAMSEDLRAQLAENFQAEPEQFVIGNGSDDILNLLIRAICELDDDIVFTRPSYSLYPVLAQMQGARSVEIPLGADFSLPVRELCSTTGAILFITNPNNPAGTWYPPEQIAEICESGQNLVVVDEAYADFSGQDCCELVSRYSNVCIVRSLSKAYGLAGLRVGYLFGTEALAVQIAKVKDSYNVGRAAQIAALAALRDRVWARTAWSDAARRRDWLSERLTTELGLKVFASRANFLLVDLGGHSAAAVLDYLRRRRILVRHFPDDPSVSNSLRISIGSEDDLKLLFDTLSSALKRL